MSSRCKETLRFIRDYLEEIDQNDGSEWSVNGNGHYKIRLPIGCVLTAPTKALDRRAMLNWKAYVKKQLINYGEYLL